MKTLSLLLASVATMVAIAILAANQLAPDTCWPNSRMIAFIFVNSAFYVFVVFALVYLFNRFKKLNVIIAAFLQIFLVVCISGVSINGSLMALTHVVHGLMGSDPCFSSLASNFLNRYAEIFWIIVFGGSSLVIANAVLVRRRRVGNGLSA